MADSSKRQRRSGSYPGMHATGLCLAAVCSLACGDEDRTMAGGGAGGSGGSAGGTGGAAGLPGLEVLYGGEIGPHALVLDGDDLFWLSGAGLRRASLGGGDVVTLAPGFGDSVLGLMPAGEYVYYYQWGPEVPQGIGRVPRAGGEPEWVANAAQPQGIVADASSVYWTDAGDDWNTGRLWRAGLDGSAPTAIASGLAGPRSMTLDAGSLYFENGNAVCARRDAASSCVDIGFFRVPITGGEPERIVSAPAASNLVLKDGAMYWLGGDGAASDVVLLAPGGAPQSIARIALDSPGDGAMLVADGDAIYWTTGARVLRMPFDTRVVSRLVTGIQSTGNVAVRGGWVYTTQWGAGNVLRIATDGSAHRPRAEPITGPCPTPVGSAEELALTPRAEPNLELLAFELEPDRVVASQETYDRLVSDITAIRTLEPTLSEVDYFAWHDGRRFQLEVTDAAARALADGVYTAWDCLNDAYGLLSFSANSPWMNLELDGTYNLELVFERYRQLPGVVGGSVGGVDGDGPKICVTRDGAQYEYVFDDTGGDCPSDCPEHRSYHFSSDAAGQIVPLETWDSTTGAPIPEWYGAVCDFQPRVGF